MLPLRHNFLSPEKRHYLQHMVRFQFTKTVLEIFLISLCIIGIVLLGGQWLLQDYFNNLTGQIVSISNQYSGTNLEIKKINQILNKNEKIQKEYVLWTPKLAELANNIPEKITLTSLNINNQNKQITLNGNSPTRDELLIMQKQISTLPWIKNMDIPLSQLTAKENINFSLTAQIK